MPWNIATREGIYPSCGRTLTARQDGSPCIDRGQEVIVEKCGAFLPLAGDKAGSVAYTENGSPTLRAESPTACVEGIDIYNGATTGNVSKTLNSAATDSDHIPCVVCYDARGNGDGKICPNVTGDHNNRITDYTAVICQRYATNSSDDGIAGTIDASYYKGNGMRNGKEREFICIEYNAYNIDSLSSNSMKSKNPYSGFHETNISKCIDTSDGNPSKNQGGTCIVEKYNIINNSTDITDSNNGHKKIVARDPNAVVYCLQGNGIDRSDTAGCNGCGWRENVCYTLNTIDRPAVCYNTIKNEDTTPQYIVRRLTPLECGRLQGMPDWYVADIPHSDANEYKLWGNGMALPNALYIMEGVIDFD